MEMLPTTEQARDLELSSFEQALLDLARPRLIWAQRAGQGLTKPLVISQLAAVLEADRLFNHAAQTPNQHDRQRMERTMPDGYPPLETAMRSMYREVRKIRNGNQYVMDDPRAHCTFRPTVGKWPPEPKSVGGESPRRGRGESPGPSPLRCSPMPTARTAMSTQDRKEYMELQECTFQPNLHKMVVTVSPRVEPRYRSSRRAASPTCPDRYRVKRGWDSHLRTDDVAPALTTYEQKERPKRYVKPTDAPLRPVERPGMDLGTSTRRHDAVKKSPRKESKDLDWGKYIRVKERRFTPSPTRKVLTDHEDDSTRQFAAMFLQLRQSHTEGWNMIAEH